MTRALYLDTSDTMSSLRSETPVSTLRYSRQNSDTPSYCPSVGSTGGREMHALKRGLLWQQRERLFSRWKERFFILTKDYLHCFKKSTGLSPMGQFIFKIKLVDLDKVEWLNKKSYSTIGLTLQQAPDCRVLLRTETGLEDWFDLLEECTASSKERRRALRKLHNPNGWDDDTSSLKFPDYLSTQSGGSIFGDTVSVADSDITKRRSKCGRETADVWYRPSPLLENRLSLLTDIDINRGSPVDTPPPSVPPTFRGRPCRLNNDVFFMAPGSTDGSRYNCGSITPSSFSNRSVLTPVGSFRSSHLFNPAHNLQVKYRERSQSDVYSSKGRSDSENRRASYILPASHM